MLKRFPYGRSQLYALELGCGHYHIVRVENPKYLPEVIRCNDCEKIANGERLKLIHPVSDLEKRFAKKSPDMEYTPLSWSQPHGYLRVADPFGGIWHFHPEAFGIEPWDPRWPIRGDA